MLNIANFGVRIAIYIFMVIILFIAHATSDPLEKALVSADKYKTSGTGTPPVISSKYWWGLLFMWYALFFVVAGEIMFTLF
jgi:hypothetical protein